MNPAELEGKSYGPVTWRVGEDAVADFIHITGDDPDRWTEHAPPGFAAAALFAVAPDLLAELYDHSIIHGEQSFTWDQPLPVDVRLEVVGKVTRVRDRGGVSFITFEMDARHGSDVALTGKSLFLVSGEAIAGGRPEFVRPEPHYSYRGDPADDQLAASRADLVRYAAATRDWNPVHWDHDAGVAAGFPGVVVHGLLQAGWALRVASTGTTGARPFESARFRFRNPLLPARPVTPAVESKDESLDVVISDDDHEYLTATVVLASE